MIRTCPTCGEKFDDTDGNIYCPKCGSIADDSVLLSEKIQKKVSGARSEQQQSRRIEDRPTEKKQSSYKDEDFNVSRISTESSSHTGLIIACVVVVVAIAAYFLFIK